MISKRRNSQLLWLKGTGQTGIGNLLFKIIKNWIVKVITLVGSILI
jgi:hypothetical protein